MKKEHWQKVRLGDVCDYYFGRISTNNLTARDYISTENILPNKSGITISSGLPSTQSVSEYKKDTVLVSNIRPYFKKIWYATRDGGCSNDILVFKAKNDYYSKFLYYLLSEDRFFDYATQTAKGTKMPRGDKSAILNYPVPDIPLPTQRAIAAILSCLDDKIALNNRTNANLEAQAQAIYDQFFGFCSSQTIPISKIIDVRDGTHDSPKSLNRGYPLVTSKHLLPYSVDVISPNRISKADFDKINQRSKVNTYDILISMIGTIGLISLVIEKNVSFAIKNIGLFKTSQKKDWVYLVLCHLKSLAINQYIDTRLAGSTQKYISLSELRQIPIMMPTDIELKRFNHTVAPLFEEIIVLTEANYRLAAIRDTLLPRLMSGELVAGEE